MCQYKFYKSILIMKLFYFLALTILLFCSSCKNTKEQNDKQIQIDLSSTQPINFKEIVEKITLIPLETNDSCLIKRISQLEASNNYFFINNDMKEVLIFDKHGKFINSSIKNKEKNYSTIANMDITNNELISIFNGNTIYEYNTSMSLVNKYKIMQPVAINFSQEMPRHLKLDDYTYLMRDDENTFIYSIKEQKILNHKREFFHQNMWTGIVNKHRFLKQDGQVYFSPAYICDTLYLLDKKHYMMKPFIIYNMGEDGINLNELPKDMNIQYYVNYLFQTDKYFLSDKIHLPYADLAFILHPKDNKSYVTYNNQSGTFKIYENGEKCFPIPHSVFNNTLIYAAMPSEISKYVDSTLIDKKEWQLIKNLEEDDNQVLICYIMKSK